MELCDGEPEVFGFEVLALDCVTGSAAPDVEMYDPGIRVPEPPARRVGFVAAGWDERAATEGCHQAAAGVPSSVDCDVHGIGVEDRVAPG